MFAFVPLLRLSSCGQPFGTHGMVFNGVLGCAGSRRNVDRYPTPKNVVGRGGRRTIHHNIRGAGVNELGDLRRQAGLGKRKRRHTLGGETLSAINKYNQVLSK